jgi:exopolyphosphatase/guanosine-5'-triphosphate,3'-diphosphate pyrophosphatase
MRNLILVLLIAAFLPACQTHVPECGTEVRAAFDVGSGSTKMKVAELNTCTNTIQKVLLEEQAKIDYRESIEKSSDETISGATTEAGIKALNSLKEKAQKSGAQKFSGVATAAFRQAKNGEQVVRDIREATGIPLRVISQNLEALIGFQAASFKTKKDPAQIIAWDIGGGSQQIVTLNDEKQASIYLGQLASVSFKNRVIQEVKKKNPKKITSPNPLTKNQISIAAKIAEKEAVATVPADIQKRLGQKDLSVIGIGGVLGKSVQRQLAGAAKITPELIQATLNQKAGVTDGKNKDPYAATDITNLILVYGFMQGLKIKSYQPVDVNLIDGLWFQQEFWTH